MKIFPAIDIKDKKCVRLVNGDFDKKTEYNISPVEQASQYKDHGFSILGFPCNQFGFQEPGDNRSIREFCDTHYNVTFPVFSKVDVNGPNAHPLYQQLKAAQGGLLGVNSIKWNFTKFLVGTDGTVLSRYGPNRQPKALEPIIIKTLDTAVSN